MNPFENIYKDNLHHAYLVVGNIPLLRQNIFDFLPTIGVEVFGNPDFRHSQYDTLTIDIARDISVSVAQKDFGGSRKFFVIETNIITEEAQNALLKVFEEPTFGTHFFILMPQDILLPTLRSRLHVLNLPRMPLGISQKIPRGILGMKIDERLAMIKKITDGISDEEKTKQDAVTLLNQIESELYEKGVEKESEKLQLCQFTRGALYDRGAPIKIILENLIISL